MFHCGGYFSPPSGYDKPLGQRGFSLLEMAVSLLIISYGIITILPNIAQSVRMSSAARGTVTAVQLARNLLSELQLEDKIKEGKEDGKFEDFEDYSYAYEIEKVKLSEILIKTDEEGPQVKGDLVVNRLYKIRVEVFWVQSDRERNYEAHSFLFAKK
jgi:prepilin-type N-terminal cleavage/methylation domain-containing protein